jgi:hypothetical protein
VVEVVLIPTGSREEELDTVATDAVVAPEQGRASDGSHPLISSCLSLSTSEVALSFAQLGPGGLRRNHTPTAQGGLIAQLLQRRGPAADVGNLVEEPVVVLRLDPGCQILGRASRRSGSNQPV